MPVALSDFVYWFDSSGWLGILGLALTLLGFTATAIGLIKSATAADQAKKAAADAVLEVKKLKIIIDLSTAGAELEEIKRLARTELWIDIPERLSRVRRLLITTKGSHPQITAPDREAVLDAIVAFNEIEKRLIKQPFVNGKINAARINASLIDHADRLVEIIARTL